MQRSAFILQVLLMLCFIEGVVFLIAPGKVYQAHLRVHRIFHRVSQGMPPSVVSSSSVLRYRALGLLHLLIAFVFLAPMRFQFGKHRSEIGPQPMGVAQRHQECSSLQEIVVKIVQPHIRNHDQVGLVVSVIAHSRSEVIGFGRVDLSSTRMPDGDTLYEIGSISKVFTAILLATLVVQNRLSLETPLAYLAPPLPPDSPPGRITLKDLVTHTSGLPRLPRFAFSPRRFWLALTAGNPYEGYTDELMLEALSRFHPDHLPEKELSYSNFGFGLLGMVLSRQSRMHYPEMVQSMICKPLGLRNTCVQVDEEQSQRMAPGYRSLLGLGPYYLAQRADRWDFPSSIAGAGGIRSTGKDMLAFLAANMDRATTSLSPALSLSHSLLFSRNEVRIGMGWFGKQLGDGSRSVLWHNGLTGGYASFIAFSDDKRFGVVILGNLSTSVDRIGMEILARLAEYPDV